MSSSTKILLVNSDKDLSEALVYQFSLNEKYLIIESDDEDSVLTLINNNSFNIIITILHTFLIIIQKVF